MAIERVELNVAAELPDIAVTWRDSAGAVIPFVTDPHTFRLVIGAKPSIVKGILGGDQTGVTPSDTAPNLTIAFAVGELDDIRPGFYSAELRALRSSDGKERAPMRFDVHVHGRQRIASWATQLVTAVATVTGTDVL